ncbi:glycosyltransferase family 4 protein [Luteococcus sp. Sow4_B9]|uniref:glycosyltransferase family 4 protein n=1 Tax=Luteococcus sp. Sow4_B9 TaxID=3438792 RepID=UPI003F9B4CFD
MNGANRLRVGIVCPYSFTRAGGVQNHVMGLAGWLAAQGHQPAILAPGRADPAALRAAGLCEDVFTTAGPAIPLAYNGSVARVNASPHAALKVRNWLTRGGFDLVHLHEPMTPSVSLLALGQTQLPVVVTFHTATPGSLAMEFAYRVLPQAAERIDEAISVSSTAAEVSERYSGLRSTVIGNGIDVVDHPLEACHGRWRGGARPTITFIGRYEEPRKGLSVLLDALPDIRDHYPDLRVLVVGHGAARDVPGVDFLGALDDAGRNRVLANSDCYVAPQLGRESFGIVLLEAMASGAPVVASDLAAFREVVTDESGPIAHLFTPGSPQDCARAVLASLAEPRDLHLERGRRRAEAFDWQVLGPRIEEVYQQAIVEAPARPANHGLARHAFLDDMPTQLARHSRTRQPRGLVPGSRRSRRSPRLGP